MLHGSTMVALNTHPSLSNIPDASGLDITALCIRGFIPRPTRIVTSPALFSIISTHPVNDLPPPNAPWDKPPISTIQTLTNPDMME